MLRTVPVLAVMLLSQAPESLPQESKGLQILWMPRTLAITSNQAPGFSFRDPISETDKVYPEAQDLQGIIATLPPFMRDNGIWISASNAFLYTDDEHLQFKTLVELAKAKGIAVFLWELGAQPPAWKRIDGR